VKEINRLKILQDVIDRNLRPGQAAEMLDMRPHLLYSRALLAYRNSSPDAEDIAKTAISSNRRIPGLLSKCRWQPKSNSGYITLGERDEAIDYVNNNIKSWIRTHGAIEWIAGY